VVPVANPRFAMVVAVNDPDPAKGYYGGLVSAPVFKNVMEGALRLMDVAPDDIDTWLAAQAEAEAKRLKANGGRPVAGAPVLPVIAAASTSNAALPAPVQEGTP
jgi:cell division protein FtsI (penicillin-binding protein 3)